MASQRSLQNDHHGQRSTMFDATFTPRGAHVSTLRANGQIRYWITVIFGHLKALGGTGEAADLIKETLVNVLDVKVASSACPEPVNWYGVVTVESRRSQRAYSKVF
ncbi:hypothetical protein EYZ11_000897 [Aspergillus tanneri]|uniref:Uncharacterized protein n=1 Tax=Aspergillus tanneri TaxID=1220188 RepID=A0A4V3UQM5_9EURO|nr:hypothetical protein EYZ11_000897 [Aspergillus tanneri]